MREIDLWIGTVFVAAIRWLFHSENADSKDRRNVGNRAEISVVSSQKEHNPL
jgi:hypothetical protein